jgi:hypothetical protein
MKERDQSHRMLPRPAHPAESITARPTSALDVPRDDITNYSLTITQTIVKTQPKSGM